MNLVGEDVPLKRFPMTIKNLLGLNVLPMVIG
jgi:hypothetical protein